MDIIFAPHLSISGDVDARLDLIRNRLFGRTHKQVFSFRVRITHRIRIAARHISAGGGETAADLKPVLNGSIIRLGIRANAGGL